MAEAVVVDRLLVYEEDYNALAAGRPWVLCPIRVAPIPGPLDIGHATHRSTKPWIRVTVTHRWEGRGLDRDWCLLTLRFPA